MAWTIPHGKIENELGGVCFRRNTGLCAFLFPRKRFVGGTMVEQGKTENTWTRGQRWVSDGEPELGLGIIRNSGDGRVEIAFPAAGETRIYAIDTAPLRRVRFMPGDRIKNHAGAEMTVERVRKERGLRIYETHDGDVPEADLSDSISFSKPEERLFGG